MMQRNDRTCGFVRAVPPSEDNVIAGFPAFNIAAGAPATNFLSFGGCQIDKARVGAQWRRLGASGSCALMPPRRELE